MNATDKKDATVNDTGSKKKAGTIESKQKSQQKKLLHRLHKDMRKAKEKMNAAEKAEKKAAKKIAEAEKRLAKAIAHKRKVEEEIKTVTTRKLAKTKAYDAAKAQYESLKSGDKFKRTATPKQNKSSKPSVKTKKTPAKGKV